MTQGENSVEPETGEWTLNPMLWGGAASLPVECRPNLLEVCPGFVVDRDKVEWARAELRSDGTLITVRMVGGSTPEMLWRGSWHLVVDGMADLAEGRWRRRDPVTPMHPGDLGIEPTGAPSDDAR